MTTWMESKASLVGRYAWTLLFGLGLVFSLSSLAILFIGLDANDFQTSTGLVWSELETDMPGVAQYMNRLVRLLGIMSLGFGLLWTIVAWCHYRRGHKWSWYALWVVPVMLAAVSATFFTYQAAGLGLYYAMLAFIALLGLVLPYRTFFASQAAKTEVNGG